MLLERNAGRFVNVGFSDRAEDGDTDNDPDDCCNWGFLNDSTRTSLI